MVTTDASVRGSAFVREFKRFAKSDIHIPDLQLLCTSGALRTASSRSLVWRVLLHCLPKEFHEWVPVLERNRRIYAEQKATHIANPRDSKYSQDPQVNNPLADGHQCPWSRYFADGELRRLIAKDVERTFPEMEFFQDAAVRTLMCNVLLVYAKQHPYISYKQGMHEILAPLVFVLFSDLQSYQHSLEQFELRILQPREQYVLSVLFDASSLEHDSFSLFCEVMRELLPWYEDGACTSPDAIERQPFQRVQDSATTSQLLSELRAIGHRLGDLDAPLYRHLSSLDIAAQLYGIRWLRLLFGREFPMHDLLFVWDVIFTERPFNRIVECIFLAMLVYIRELLLQSDYGGCLHYLMRYPPVVDVVSFLQLALHFRAPLKNPRPRNISMTNYAHMTVQGTMHPNNGVRKHHSQPPPPKRGTEPVTRTRNRGAHLLGAKQRQVFEHGGVAVPAWEHVGEIHELKILEEQVAVLQQCVNERDIIAAISAKRIADVADAVESGDCSPNSRRSLAERLRVIGSQLGSQTVSAATNGTVERLPPPPAGPIEVAREVRCIGRLGHNNEMKDLSHSNLQALDNSPPTSQPHVSVLRDRVIGIPKF